MNVMRGASATHLEALLWVLFSDANSRFNTLIEECAHLQETIQGLIGKSTLVNEVIALTRSDDLPQGFERPVACDPKSDPRYYDIPVRDRAFLSLWNALGAQIIGLHHNQTTHRSSYELLVCGEVGSDIGSSQRLYWYLSQRAYFLQPVFEHYTRMLEHAHEKLIQMLENQAGTLPQPILLRRWNSAAYGEFLSEYSRHVNWESGELVRRLWPRSNGPHRSGSQRDTARSVPPESIFPDAITHTWSHQPTSYASSFDVHMARAGVTRSKRFGIIRSAYFYLEQPLLFPLLYHECAHLNFPSNDSFMDVPDSFFGSRLIAVMSLRHAQFTVTDPGMTYENFWDHFTEEVWSDAISVALGGRAYLLALALQLVGQSGEQEFSHYRIEEDTIYPLDQLGKVPYRKYEAKYPELSMSTFWEARLAIACAVLKSLKGDNAQKEDLQLIAALEELQTAWIDSGHHAFDAYGTSEGHEQLWDHRIELNEWVQSTIWAHLNEHIQVLAECSRINSTYVLNSPNTAEWINRSVAEQRQTTVGAVPSDEFKMPATFRLEEVALDVRMRIARDIAVQLSGQAEQSGRWTDSFANWTRGDGALAFRIALEFSTLRRSLMEALADICDRRPGEDAGTFQPFDDTPISQRLRALAGRLPTDNRYCSDLLRKKELTNWTRPSSVNIKLETEILAELNSIADQIMASNRNGPIATAAQAGTLTFGVVRPGEYAAITDGTSPYLKVGERLKNQVVESAKWHSTLCKSGIDADPDPTAVSTSLLSLVGEYQYLTYVKGSTPVERDAHVHAEVSRLLVKPRLVLSVGGKPLDEAIEQFAATHYARVSLIRYRYRWQWSELRALLDEDLRLAKPWLSGYSLLLSSAWEDAILITWHRHSDDLWESSNRALNVTYGSADVQSNFHVPDQVTASALAQQQIGNALEPAATPSNDWYQTFATWAEQSGLVRRIYGRSGRYDYTVVWAQPSQGDSVPAGSALSAGVTAAESSSLDACSIGLASLPHSAWRGLASFITSFEKRTFALDPRGQPHHDSEHGGQPARYKAVTHFALRDRELPP
ncbi:hypothetical protein HZ992_18940 [Rhizobacter sp. AJA081-3]|uniref:hypothetical protein n=1 Tax=Rhizobacter sp. AJA081-3 TaxID=2753607 RepID=UPI001ADF03DF|nr:hypothetical protein [Rhizobacter sp. AJA081-3]QTN22217.1 hypothetical protein HZ992_18940 [Rhizobacter sp. AJA081-3]